MALDLKNALSTFKRQCGYRKCFSFARLIKIAGAAVDLISLNFLEILSELPNFSVSSEKGSVSCHRTAASQLHFFEQFFERILYVYVIVHPFGRISWEWSHNPLHGAYNVACPTLQVLLYEPLGVSFISSYCSNVF